MHIKKSKLPLYLDIDDPCSYLAIVAANVMPKFKVITRKEAEQSDIAYDLSSGIQVSDKIDALLQSNAACRILLTREENTYWDDKIINEDNLYCTNSLEELYRTLEFFHAHKNFIKREYGSEE